MGLELGVCGGLELGPIGSITPANAAIPEKKKYDESPDGEETVGPIQKARDWRICRTNVWIAKALYIRLLHLVPPHARAATWDPHPKKDGGSPKDTKM